jgi:hypothetical protein
MLQRELLLWLAALGALLLSGAAYLFQDGAAPPAIVWPAGPAAAAQGQPAARIPAQPAATGKRGTEAEDQRLLMLRTLNASRDYRAYFHKAIEQPGAGGVQYGLMLLNMCKRFTRGSAEPANASPAQLASRRTLVERCNFSEEERVAAREQFAYARTSTMLRDPLFNALANLAGAKSAEQRRAAIDGILATEDPLIIHTLFLNPTDDGKIYFDGKWYQGEREMKRLQNAYALAECALGADCGADSLAYHYRCVNDDICGDGVQQAVSAATLGDFAEHKATRFLGLGMIKVIAYRNVGAFIPITK